MRFAAVVLVVLLAGVTPNPDEPGTGAAPVRGWATWCAPTPKYCHGWGGDALVGAVPSFRWGDKPYRVRVTAGGRSVVVTVVSFCGCGDRRGDPTLVDLSPAAFRRLAPLSQGIVRVTLTRVADIPLPQTDTE